MILPVVLKNLPVSHGNFMRSLRFRCGRCVVVGRVVVRFGHILEGFARKV
jgi:hypothetical protein